MKPKWKRSTAAKLHTIRRFGLICIYIVVICVRKRSASKVSEWKKTAPCWPRTMARKWTWDFNCSQQNEKENMTWEWRRKIFLCIRNEAQKERKKSHLLPRASKASEREHTQCNYSFHSFCGERVNSRAGKTTNSPNFVYIIFHRVLQLRTKIIIGLGIKHSTEPII